MERKGPVRRQRTDCLFCSLLRHAEPTPRRRRLGLRRIPAHQQHLQFVGLQPLCGATGRRRPEAKPPAREPLLAQPEPLAVIN